MLLFLDNLFIKLHNFVLFHIFIYTASLKQPGMEVADWEAKLLRIEQLQIELEVTIFAILLYFLCSSYFIIRMFLYNRLRN